jgi:hypothetical protein
MLSMAGVSYTDVRVSFADWKKLKPTTPMDQLPSLELADGTVISKGVAKWRVGGSGDVVRATHAIRWLRPALGRATARSLSLPLHQHSDRHPAPKQASRAPFSD